MTSTTNLNATQILVRYIIRCAVDKKGTGQWTVDSIPELFTVSNAQSVHCTEYTLELHPTVYSLQQHNSTQHSTVLYHSSQQHIFDATYCLHWVGQITTLISNICLQEQGKGLDKSNLAQFVMSVRDRIANLNSSKAPIITAAGSSLSADNLHKSHGSAEATSTNSTEAAAAPESSDLPAPKSSIADRIARLKLGEVGKESNESSSAGDAAPKSISSISSKIAMLGANVRLGERPPGAMFSSPSSHQASNIGSRVNTSSSCNSDNQADVGSITKSGASGESASLVHVRRGIFIG